MWPHVYKRAYSLLFESSLANIYFRMWAIVLMPFLTILGILTIIPELYQKSRLLMSLLSRCLVVWDGLPQAPLQICCSRGMDYNEPGAWSVPALLLLLRSSLAG